MYRYTLTYTHFFFDLIFPFFLRKPPTLRQIFVNKKTQHSRRQFILLVKISNSIVGEVKTLPLLEIFFSTSFLSFIQISFHTSLLLYLSLIIVLYYGKYELFTCTANEKLFWKHCIQGGMRCL